MVFKSSIFSTLVKTIAMKSQCKMCKKLLVGRSDKVFCSLDCKNEYHVKLRRVTRKATHNIDKILHRNRSILLELMGKNAYSKKLPRQLLDKKKFNYTYITHYHVNKQGKMVRYVYDYSWMIFSDQEVLIKRIGKKG